MNLKVFKGLYSGRKGWGGMQLNHNLNFESLFKLKT